MTELKHAVQLYISHPDPEINYITFYGIPTKYYRRENVAFAPEGITCEACAKVAALLVLARTAL